MKRIFAIPILVFASSMIFLYFVLPQISAQERAKKSFLKKEQDVKNRQEYFNKLKDINLEMAGYQEILQKIDLSLPGEISLVDLISFFDQKTEKNGLILKSVAPIQETKAPEEDGQPKMRFQSFSISLSGSISSFESFLKDLETSLRLIDVETISLQKSASAGDSSMGINIQVKVYY